MLCTDLLANVSYLNRAAETMTGWSRADALGRPLEEVFRILDAAPREAAAGPALRAIVQDRAIGPTRDCVLVHRDGRQAAIEHSQHDTLTGLPNRLLLTERLSRAIVQALRNGKQLALPFLDLDHFKHINDSLGHAIGDRLLATVANRLKESVRATDTVFRRGGGNNCRLFRTDMDDRAVRRPFFERNRTDGATHRECVS